MLKPGSLSSGQAIRLASATFILALVVSNPARLVLAQGPPQLPPQAQAVLEGELEVQIEDSEQGSRTHRFIRTNTGRFRLELAGDGPDWLSGSRVRARGRFKDAETLELGSGNDLEPMALANANTFGDQRTIVILVNFQDKQAIPYSASQAAGVTFNTTSDFFNENSHGQAWLSGDVAGWFTLARFPASRPAAGGVSARSAAIRRGPGSTAATPSRWSRTSWATTSATTTRGPSRARPAVAACPSTATTRT